VEYTSTPINLFRAWYDVSHTVDILAFVLGWFCENWWIQQEFCLLLLLLLLIFAVTVVGVVSVVADKAW
jgi:hypothetical protein